MHYLVENLNLNYNICFSPKTIWILVVMGVFSVHTVIRLLWFVCRFRFGVPSPSSASIKKKKRSDHKKKREDTKTTTDVSVADISRPLLEDTKVSCVRKFNYQSLADATQGFSSECCIGADSLGHFFIGKMVDTDKVVTIRNIWVYDPHYGRKEFVAHVSLLSQANHSNLAKLIGYSFHRQWERSFVYEYVSGGSLQDYLYDNDKCLDWEVRMEIALGVARGVEYLQKKMKPPFLHLYIEPCNVWLNEEYIPKLSAYGEVMMYSREKGVDFPRQMIGSFCYANLDYERTKNVTVDTDIYGFGILLLKIITGKQEHICRDGLLQTFLHWVQPYLKDKLKMVEMVDPKLGGKFKIDELYEVCDIAEACLNEQPDRRPSIVDLVKRMNHLVTPNYDSLRKKQ